MSRVSDAVSNDFEDSPAAGQPAGNRPVRRAIEGRFVCPFCGSTNARTDEPCATCNMDNTPATRNSTRARIGPWYVLQKGNPAAPGMKYDTLIKFVRKGRIQPRAVMRGPTTTQLWRFAASVKGVSREFGLCYNCAGDIDAETEVCPHCGRDQNPPPDPDVLLESTIATKAAPTAANTPDLLNFSDVDDAAAAVPPRPQASPRPAPANPAAIAASASSLLDADEALPPPSFDRPASVPSPRLEAPVKPTAAPAPEDSAAALAAENRRLEREQQEIEAARIARDQAPRDPTKSSPTLSPRELATAFQLDFYGTKSKSRKISKVLVAAVLLVGVAGGTVAAYLKVPAFKDWTDKAYVQANNQVQQWIAQIQGTAPSTPSRAGGNAPMPQDLSLQSTAAAAPIPSGSTSPKASPAADPAPAITNNLPAMTPPAETPAATPVATPTVSTPAAATAIDPSNMSLDDAITRSRAFWRQALDAESKGDWAGAVADYEQIKLLPQKSWPSSLTLRLTEARGHTGG